MAGRIKYQVIAILILMAAQSTFGQKNTISDKDSIRFAKLSDNINRAYQENPKLADSLSHIYFTEAKKINNDDYSGRGAALISCSYLIAEDIEKAKQWHSVADAYFKSSKNFLWKGYTNMNMGITLNKRYDVEKGFPYLLQSVKDFEQAKDYNMVTAAYTSISLGFHNFQNYKEGQEYAQMALKVIAANKVNETHQWRAYNALAINYDDNEEWDKAIEAHLKAIKNGGKRSFHQTYNNLGNTYKKKGQLENAMKYFNLALADSEEAGDYEFATVYGNISDVYRMQHNYSLAQKYVDSTLYYSKKSNSPEKLIDAYDFAYQLKNDTGDYKAAAAYLKKYVSIKDSLLNAEKARILFNYKEQYETEKKQKLIEQQQFEISKKNYWLIIASITFALFCIVAYFVYRAYRHKQDKKLQKEIFRQQEIESKALFDGEQKERIRIARDLHDGVGQMLSLVKMNLSMADNENPTIKSTSDLVDKSIEEVRNVSHNLIPQELNFGIFNALEDIAEKVNSSGETKMVLEIPQEIRSLKFERQNELSIYRIVQEVVNNMIKHAGASRIDLSISQSNQSIIIAIKDNGRGMDQDSIGNSKGIGWKNINARVHLLDGKINIKSEKLSGPK